MDSRLSAGQHADLTPSTHHYDGFKSQIAPWTGENAAKNVWSARGVHVAFLLKRKDLARFDAIESFRKLQSR